MNPRTTSMRRKLFRSIAKLFFYRHSIWCKFRLHRSKWQIG
jgi:hypothetical protein